MGWFRHLLHFSASEVYDMPLIQYQAYKRWIDKWLPHLVYGSAASGGVEAPSVAMDAVPDRRRALPLSKIPGADIVRAY